MRISLAHLPKPLLAVILATLPSLSAGSSGLFGDSWCGTLMCVSATVNASIVTCMRCPYRQNLFLTSSLLYRSTEVPKSTGMDGDVCDAPFAAPLLIDDGPYFSGFGDQMANTPLVILWPTANGTIVLSQRQASGLVEPLPVTDPPRQATVALQASVVRPHDTIPTICATSGDTECLIFRSCLVCLPSSPSMSRRTTTPFNHWYGRSG